MIRLQTSFTRLLTGIFCCVAALAASAQNKPLERSFPQPKATVEQALKQMQSSLSGRLPVLDGFAVAADHPLDRYQRGFFQSRIQVTSTSSGGSLVRLSVEVTAWYADSGAHSGYQLLNSNGRLEADMMDQLAEQLGAPSVTDAPPTIAARVPFPSEHISSEHSPSEHQPSAGDAPSQPSPSAASPKSAENSAANSDGTDNPVATEPGVSAPVPQLPANAGTLNTPLGGGFSDRADAAPTKKDSSYEDSNLRAEADSLEEILRNQSHPKNLVAVKKSGTPVVESASLTSKTLFLASAHDEFEMLDYTRDWVHVRISGLSRGWIWRNSLEMPDSVPATDSQPNPVPVAAELFHVTREETAPFPGDWAPLRGKYVKIVSVEKIDETKNVDSRIRLEFVKSLLDKDYAELAQKAELAGIVVVFDSVDGGMIAATTPALQQWKSGKLSDAGLWHQCFFDPPETFTVSSALAGQQ